MKTWNWIKSRVVDLGCSLGIASVVAAGLALLGGDVGTAGCVGYAVWFLGFVGLWAADDE